LCVIIKIDQVTTQVDNMNIILVWVEVNI